MSYCIITPVAFWNVESSLAVEFYQTIVVFGIYGRMQIFFEQFVLL